MKPPSPFHDGERAAQQKAGTSGVASELAASMTDALSFTSNHDSFLAAQSFAVLTSVDLDNNDVWITPLFGRPGDIQAVSEKKITLINTSIEQIDAQIDAQEKLLVEIIRLLYEENQKYLQDIFNILFSRESFTEVINRIEHLALIESNATEHAKQEAPHAAF